MIKGGVVPQEYRKPVEAGVRETLDGGVIAGYPVVDVIATLHDGSYHDVDSSELAFKLAGSIAAQDGIKQANQFYWNQSCTLKFQHPRNSWVMLLEI